MTDRAPNAMEAVRTRWSMRAFQEVKGAGSGVMLEADASELGLPPGIFPTTFIFEELPGTEMVREFIERTVDGDVLFATYRAAFTLYRARIFND